MRRRLNYILLFVQVLFSCCGFLCADASVDSQAAGQNAPAKSAKAFRDYDHAVWGEYNNRVHGFRLRFPRDLCCIYEDPPVPVEEVEQRDRLGSIFFGQRMRLFAVHFSDHVAPVFYVGIYKNPDGLTPEGFALKDILSMAIYKREDVQVDTLRVDGWEAARLRYEDKVGGHGFVTHVYIRCHDRIYSFHLLRDYNVGGKSVSYQELHDLIFRTLHIYYRAR